MALDKSITLRIINTYEPPSPIYRDLVPYLSDNSIDVEVVISASQYRTEREPLRAHLHRANIRIVRIPSGLSTTASSARKMWVMVSFSIGATIHSIFGKSVDANLFLSQPPLFFIIGRLLRLIRGQKYICLVMDLYPDVAVVDGLLGDRSLLTRLFTWISRSALKNADAVIVIGRCMAKRLINSGIKQERIYIIHNWVNERDVFNIPAEKNVLRKEIQLSQKFVVLYSGNMGIPHYFQDIIEVAKRLKERDDIQFVFIGDGGRRGEISYAKDINQLKNVTLLPFQPTDRLAESLSLGDVHFICLRKGFEGLVVPSKAYSAFGVGRPIIYQGDPSGEIALLIDEEGIGIVVEPGESKFLEEILLSLVDNKSQVQEMGQRALKLNREKYGKKTALEQYLAVINTLDLGGKSQSS